MQILLRAWIIALVCASSVAHAQEKCQWTSWQDFGRAVSENSPDLERLRVEGDYQRTLAETAHIKPPSVLNAQYTAGELPWRASTFEGSYLFTFENKAKRQSREASAQSSSARVASEVEDTRAQQLLQIALTQQAIKRLESRREILLETRETYTKLIQRYRRIPSRGPEQETSLAVIEIAKGETDLRLHALDVEESEELYRLAVLSACDKVSLPVAPLLKLKHPVWTETEEPTASTGMKRLEAEAKVIESDKLAQLNSYASDLSVGPMVIAGREDEKTRFEFGIAASLPINAQRTTLLAASKTAESRMQEHRVQSDLERLRIKREAWKNQYRKATAAMKTGLTNEEIARSHQKFETLFRSDRISAALVIESHRQMLEHVIAYSELEAKAAEAYWNLRYLDGQLSWRDL